MELYGCKEAKLQHLHLKGQALSCVLPSLSDELASPFENKWCGKQVPYGQVPVLRGESSLEARRLFFLCHSVYEDVEILFVGVH